MEIFKYRHLALGLGAFLVSLYISYNMSNLLRVLVLVASVLAFIALITVFIVRKNKSALDIFIRCAFLCAFISLAMITSLFAFQKRELKLANDNEHTIIATVIEERYEKDYEGGYIVKIENVDGEKSSFKSLLTSSKPTLNKGDKFEATAIITSLEDTFEYDEKGTYQDDGILVKAEIEKYTLISCGNENDSIFKRLNTTLSNHFYEYLNSDTASLFSSLLLGNDDTLDPSIKRDFSRLGISHILAVSGMHITILATLIGLALRLCRVNYVLKNIILVFTTFFFVGLTGFSESAVRAGIMVCLVYLISMTGYFADMITALFLSVSLICLVSPFSIFSVSLQLSFLAMLGCLVGFKLARKIKVRIKKKILRYIVYSIKTTVIVSLVVIGFTLPVTFLTFGTLSLLSPLANLLIAPIFNLLIYFAPILLSVIGIPYVNIPFIWLSEKLSHLSILIVEWIADFKGIVIPTFSAIQYAGMVIIIASFVVMMLVKKKQLFYVLSCVLVGTLVFFSGSIANFVDKQSNVYVSTYNNKINDFIFLENKNELTVIDISTTTISASNQASSAISSLHYTEIENYIICDYSHLTNIYVDRLANRYKIKNLYINEPITDKEKEVYKEIERIAMEEGVKLKELEKTLDVSNFDIEFSNVDTLNRSERRSISLSIKANGCEILYLGSASYELFDYFTKEKAKTADIAIFGAYGPSYFVKYYYEMDYLDKAIFYGNSYNYARDKLKSELSGKGIISPSEPIKFKLKDNT